MSLNKSAGLTITYNYVFQLMAVYLVGEPGVPAPYHVAEEHKCARAVAQILLLNTVALVVLE